MKAVRFRFVFLLVFAVLLLISASPAKASTWEYVNYTENYVGQISTQHPPDDKGIHSSFPEMQDKDGTFDTLTEENMGGGGGGGGSEWLDTNANTTDHYHIDWTIIGTQPYLDAQDEPTNYVYTKSDEITLGYFLFPSTTLTGDITLNISVYGKHDDGPTGEESFFHWGHNGTYYQTANFGFLTTWGYKTITVSETFTVAEINAMQGYFSTNKIAGADDIYFDHLRLGVSAEGVGGADYELDLEVSWTDADYDETEEWLCVFGGTQDAEPLKIDIWSGTWTNIISDVVAGWNNVSISAYLTDATVEIRFIDNDQADDDILSTWEIEGVLLQTWSYAYTVEAFESIGLADTEHLALSIANTFYESVGLADTAYTSIVIIKNFFESVGVADSESVIVGFVAKLFESIGVAGVALLAVSKSRTFFESVGIAETAYTNIVILRMFYESIGISDFSTTALTISNTFFEFIGISEVVITEADLVRVFFESIGLADTYQSNIAQDIIKNFFEVIGLADKYGYWHPPPKEYHDYYQLPIPAILFYGLAMCVICLVVMVGLIDRMDNWGIFH